MHQYRGIVCTYIRSDSLSTRPYNQNTLTCQSADTTNAPRDPPSRLRYTIQEQRYFVPKDNCTDFQSEIQRAKVRARF